MRMSQLTISSAEIEGTSVGDAIRQFMLHQAACRHSQSTMDNYRVMLSRWQDWCEAHDVNTIEQFSRDVVRQWLTELTNSTMKASTVWTYTKNVRALFSWLEREELLEKSPFRNVPMPKVPNEILEPFTEDEVKALLKATSGSRPYDIRDRALIMVLLDSGIRLEELTEMVVGQVQSDGVFIIRHGKGGKDRPAYLSTVALKALRRWERIRGGKPGEALWVGQRGYLKKNGIVQLLERIGRGCGVHCHAHKFRRTSALWMLRSGADLLTVQKHLGHANLDVIQKYVKLTCADIQAAHARHSPAALVAR